jgi:hypothetical protein
MPEGLGGGDQAGIEADQHQRPPQGEFEVGRAAGAQAMRRRQPVETDQAWCIRIETHRQFAQFAGNLCPAV